TTTALGLERFFAPRSMSDIRSWARDLADGEGPSFDAWVFPQTVHTDLESVHVKSFMDRNGAALRASRLQQPDGPGGALLASYGPNQWIGIGWETEPAKPSNVHAW